MTTDFLHLPKKKKKVTIARQKTHFSVIEAFDECKKVSEEYWHQDAKQATSDRLKYEGANVPCLSKLPCLPNALTCNPSVKITLRGVNPAEFHETDFLKENPKSHDIEFYEKGVYPNGALTFETATVFDPDQQFIVIDVMDNDQKTGDDDRVIGECLIIFGKNFKKNVRNFCCVPIHDVYEQKQCGHVLLAGEWNDETSNLEIDVQWILNLTDVNSDMIKGEDNTLKDILIFSGWLVYMFLSFLMFRVIEGTSWIDAVYVRFVTAFTVGYGDIYPTTNAGKVFNSLFIILDTIAIGYLTSKAMGYILRWREFQETLRQNLIKTQRQEQRDLESAEDAELNTAVAHVVEDANGNNSSDNSNRNNIKPESGAAASASPPATAAATAAAAKNKTQTPEQMRAAMQKREEEKAKMEKQRIVKLVFIVLLILCFIVSGTLVMTLHEGNDLADAVQWNFVTLSTVGYGDVTPKTTGGKVFTIVYITFGVSLLIYFAGAVFDFLADRKAKKYKEQVMRRALISEAQLLEFDRNRDGKIDRFEFLSKMLVETGECEEDKIEEIMAKFRKLDKNNSRSITTDELRAMDTHSHTGAS